MRRRGKERRHIKLYLLAIIVLLVVTVIVGFKTRSYVPIMSPEPPEIAAKRKSPDNAFFALEALVEELPHPPDRLIVKGDERSPDVEYYDPEDDSLGSIVNVSRPDNDPLLLKYIEYGDVLSEKLKPILEEPFYFIPEIYNINKDPVYENLSKYQKISSFMITRAEFFGRRNNNSRKSFELLIDSLKFARLVASDGGGWQYSSAHSMQRDSLRHIVTLARNTDLVDTLLHVKKKLEKFSETAISPGFNIEYMFRSVDAFYNDGSRLNYGGQRSNTDDKLVDIILNTGDLIGDCVHEWQEKKERKFYREYYKTCIEVFSLPYCEYIKWEKKNPDLAKIFEESSGPILDGERWISSHSYTLAYHRGALLVLALELYEYKNKFYPETLDRLVPEYIDEIPIDPFDGVKFKYRKLEKDYVLYSIGNHGNGDDGGKIGLDIIIHGPQDEIEDR